MAYYLGRDIDIAITTESELYGIVIADGLAPHAGVQTAEALDFRIDANVGGTAGAATKNSKQFTSADGQSGKLFAGPKSCGAETNAAHNPWAGIITGASAGTAASYLKNNTWTNVPSNITGMDVSFGVQDEDVAFVGQRNVLKAEIRKDNSVTFTRKKSNNTWAVAYNDARFGLIDHNALTANGLFNLPYTESFTDATCDTTDDATVTCSANSDIAVGQYVSGSGVPAGAAVLSVDTPGAVESFELTAATTGGSLTNTTLTFTSTNPFHNGLTAPDYIRCGYRLYLRFGGTGAAHEIFVLRNAYITDYSVTMGADASQEESISFTSGLDPIITSGVVSDALDAATDLGEL
tara:strand:+ start:918 stop:1967 length:1050 start_codon:yes stop_codon:yes gene_type:complete